jgi:hypothetical protein
MNDKIETVLWFLSLGAAERDRLLKPHGIRGLTFKRLKLSQEGLERRRRSRQKRSKDPIHSNFEALMEAFRINMGTGEVEFVNRNGKPARLRSGYLLHTFKGRSYLLHRLVMMKSLGRSLSPGEEVDHINMIKDDNRAENLRIVTPKANKAAWQAIKKGKKV